MHRELLAFLFVGFVSAAAPSARADIPPPDSCTTVGESCNNAGPGYDQGGTCVTSTCTRATPDGSVQYECSRCIAGSGTGGASGAGGGTTTGGSAGAGAGAGGGATTGGSTSAGDAGEKAGASSDDGCGCSFASKPPATPALFAALGLAALAVRRSRRG